MSTMATNQQLNFLQEKIREIGSAIFFNLSDSVLKLPTSIITSMDVDDYGYVWFFIQRPRQALTEFEKEFPVRLDFFKKGKDCFLQVNGKGRVVEDPEEIREFLSWGGEADGVLVKVKILKAEYYEKKTGRQSWLISTLNTVTAWFRSSHPYRQQIYYPAS